MNVQEASFLAGMLHPILQQIEDEELSLALHGLRNGKLSERDALLTLVKIDALRRVVQRVQSKQREAANAAVEG